jgi:hypothetical protein
MLNLADLITGGLGILQRPLSAEALIELAQRRTGCTDFGAVDFRDALDRFLAACASESDPSLVGRLATRWDVLRFLSNLLRLRAAETQDPAVLDEAIERPIFITGLPRSGTTFLHRLLLEDPDNHAPTVWQTIHPTPPPGRDERIARVAGQLRAFERLAPEFRGLHPLEATSPQECSEITAHVFRSLRFDTTYRMPSYRAWLDADGQAEGYRFERRFLQHLQHQRRAEGGGEAPFAPGLWAPGRWVLKCPDHVFALAELRAAFPDARIVFVHRDPIKVLLSVAKLTEVLRRPFTRSIDPMEIGRGESARWQEGTERMIAAADAEAFAEPICHVHHLDLVRDPLAAVQRLYDHFGLALRAPAAAAIGRLVAARPNGGYHHGAYRFAEHGLDLPAEREKFARYIAHFAIHPEPVAVAQEATLQRAA